MSRSRQLRAVTAGKRVKNSLGLDINDDTDPYQSMYQQAFKGSVKEGAKIVTAKSRFLTP
jgi:hypothetical protein